MLIQLYLFVREKKTDESISVQITQQRELENIICPPSGIATVTYIHPTYQMINTSGEKKKNVSISLLPSC